MYLKKDIYEPEKILGMLDIALSEMIENDCCSKCLNKYEKDISICNNTDMCKSYLFEGIAKAVYQNELRNLGANNDTNKRGAKLNTEMSKKRSNKY